MSKEVRIGKIKIGGNNPIAIQSMTNIKTSKKEEVINQINLLERAGCHICRLAIKDDEDANSIPYIKSKVNIPIVGDIHFDYKLAIKSIENGIDKIRINPGNIGSDERIQELAKYLIRYNVPIRVGSNTGSIEKHFLEKYGRSEIALAESALNNVATLERFGVNNIVISAKASDVKMMVGTYRYLKEKTDYPLHIGVTEAGTAKVGSIKNAIGIGSLLLDGIGDTIRVSLTADPIEEIEVAKRILRSLNIGDSVDIVSCPTCGRTEYNLIELANYVESKYCDINKKIKIAVMGCVVNGPGEAMDADIGVAGSKDYCVIFKKGEVIKKVPFDRIKEEFDLEIEKLIWKE